MRPATIGGFNAGTNLSDWIFWSTHTNYRMPAITYAELMGRAT